MLITLKIIFQTKFVFSIKINNTMKSITLPDIILLVH
ncbi:unnamed protein product [Schistosoma mattheei]|uniref:Uncharacterized protein n=1 Tax=Schistosoma mattheei TaxID=31246 RepID=A0A183PRJ3_9TREM|nr:unnamed protein product [Schistosoma mattheei]